MCILYTMANSLHGEEFSLCILITNAIVWSVFYFHCTYSYIFNSICFFIRHARDWNNMDNLDGQYLHYFSTWATHCDWMIFFKKKRGSAFSTFHYSCWNAGQLHYSCWNVGSITWTMPTLQEV
jgi:hypothetical protein